MEVELDSPELASSGDEATGAGGGASPSERRNSSASAKGGDILKAPAAVPAEGVGKKRGNKTKRLTRQGSREGIVNGVHNFNDFVAPQRRWKNTRRPHNGYGRGLPKKGGAGGKGVWGKIGSEILAEEDYEDQNDPNYDIETDDRNIELKEVVPETTPVEFFKQAEPIILEYFEHGDTHEVAISFDEILTSSNLRQLVTTVSIEIGMDHKDSQREMISLLISDLYGKVVTSKDIIKGFDILLNNLPDQILDTPEAPVLLGNFIARAVADDCIPPIYAMSYNGLDSMNEHAIVCIKRAQTLLSMKQSMVHLDNIWGLAGPLRPVKTITKQMIALLKEFIQSRDVDEAHRCLRVLEVPHYHHELVYEAIVMSLEGVNQQTEDAMCQLLKTLDDVCLVSPAMMEQGFQRVYDDMADIVLDVPLAYVMLDRFVERCSRLGFLSDKVIRNMPTRGRKRFVSEGDGGNIKFQSLPFRD